jgi:ketosteroid isomerase-like protein
VVPQLRPGIGKQDVDKIERTIRQPRNHIARIALMQPHVLSAALFYVTQAGRDAIDERLNADKSRFRMAFTTACAEPQVAPSPPDQNHPRLVAERLFAAFNRHDVAGIAALYAPDAVIISSDYCTPRRGPDGAAEIHAALFAELPQLQDEVLEYVADADTVAVKFVAHSTTPGREFDLPIVALLEVRDGLIVRDEAIFNTRGQPCTP